jgi:excisionase family DNA binding protein
MSAHLARGTDVHGVLTVEGLAHYLRLPISTAYRLAERREIPGFKVGRRWRFYRPVLDEWFRRRAATRLVTILIADDDPRICQLFESALAGNDRRLLTARGGEQAVRLSEETAIDLAILDLVMPGLNGVQTLRVLRGLYPSVPVILVTGFPDSSLLQEALDVGPFTVLPKPVGLGMLRTAGDMLLRRRADTTERRDTRAASASHP